MPYQAEVDAVNFEGEFMNRIDELISELERELHIEFPASRRESAKGIIDRWLHKYDVPKPEVVLPSAADLDAVADEQVIKEKTDQSFFSRKSKGKSDAAGQ